MADIEVLTALSSLAAFGAKVPAITNSFRLEDTPDKLANSQLPALVIFPGGGRGDEFKFQTFMANAGHFKFSVVQQLYFAPSDSVKYAVALPKMMQLLMKYIRTAQSQGFLDTRDTTDGSKPWQVPLNFTPVVGPRWGFADVDYHGIQFTYNFDIQL